MIRSEYAAHQALSQQRQVPSWQKPAPVRAQQVTQRSVKKSSASALMALLRLNRP
jgi:hypothetical protein